MASVVIPAYNEGRIIERCLSHLLADAEPGELEVIVVCNGCRDDTAARARRFADRGVTVLETDIPSKSNALNLGDAQATRFPRVYLDADIRLGISAIREMAAMLGEDSQLVVVSPRPVVDLADRSWGVRAYYRVWTELPYFKEGMIGSGVYAFSRRGRARFGTFPDIIADDEYARRVAAPTERANTPGATFTITPPKNLRSIINVNTRVRAGMYELEARFPELSTNKGTDAGRTLRVIASRPDLWPFAPVYLGVMLVAKVRGHRKLRRREHALWNRDETARGAP
ncbi:MAG: glycosyltransferase [Polyangiaceae bacterium]|nr:glycosyltransferase [Polyangiaceae bacterium]